MLQAEGLYEMDGGEIESAKVQVHVWESEGVMMLRVIT